MRHIIPRPVRKRPRCMVCHRPLAPHFVYESREIPKEVFDRIHAQSFGKRRMYEDEDGAKLQWLESSTLQVERGQYYATFKVHDGNYGLDGKNHFHALTCASIYGEAAAKSRPPIFFTR